MQELEENWILIRGATSGIGHELARLLASNGQNLVLVCQDEEKLCQIASELNEISDIIIMPMDLKEDESSTALFDECRRLGLKINEMYDFAQEIQ